MQDLDTLQDPDISDKSIRKVWSEEIKQQAFSLYLESEKPSPSVIADELGVPERTIISWRDKYGWVQKRAEMYGALEEQTYNDALVQLQVRRKRALDRLDNMMDVSYDAMKEEDLEFKDKKQAFDSFIRTHQTVEGLADKEISRVLIISILNIIHEEVEDAETKQRISEKLFALASSGRIG